MRPQKQMHLIDLRHRTANLAASRDIQLQYKGALRLRVQGATNALPAANLSRLAQGHQICRVAALSADASVQITSGRERPLSRRLWCGSGLFPPSTESNGAHCARVSSASHLTMSAAYYCLCVCRLEHANSRTKTAVALPLRR